MHIKPEDIKTHYLVITVMYLAYVINLVQENLHQVFSNSELNILYNVCLPIKYFEGDKVVKHFSNILLSAYHLSQSPSVINDFSVAKEILATSKYNEHDPETKIFLIPESVAEVASYITSIRARNGIHVLVDFGSGTTDISIFNVKKLRTRAQVITWYSAEIIAKGMLNLKYLLEQKSNSSRTLRELVGLTINQHIIANFFHFLWKECSDAWWKAYEHMKNQDYWKSDQVIIYISGGGANINAVYNVFNMSGLRYAIGTPFEYYHDIQPLPVPDDFSDRHSVPFSRLCVAYGLARSKGELMKYVLPSEAGNDTPEKITIIRDIFEEYKDYGGVDT